MDLVIVEGPYVNLLAMNWFEHPGIEVMDIKWTSTASLDFKKVCVEFPSIFNRTLILYSGPSVSLQLDPAIQPSRLKACRVHILSSD